MALVNARRKSQCAGGCLLKERRRVEKALFCNKRSKYVLVDDLYYLVFVWWRNISILKERKPAV